MEQIPAPESFMLKWKGDSLTVTLKVGPGRKGRASLRTNLGAASTRRREIIAETESGVTPLAKAWNDIPMSETSPGEWSVTVPLEEVGVFSCKACFFPEGSRTAEWPHGRNFHVKVSPEVTRSNNSIYTVFTRQFGPAMETNPRTESVQDREAYLDHQGYTVIPPSGTFRNVIRHLDTIMDEMRFKIVQVLPIFPVPTTYARMGRFGCPFAATDFLSVDPAYAEDDKKATPLDQFVELIDAVHSKGGLLFVDLPANHTGWASTLQTHHPEWYKREKDGTFISPGAWGVVWSDLVALDYSRPELRAYMAEVFLFWCRLGVDGFRCDAGYMIPESTWIYIVARVREEYPETIFMLEGLGGKLEVTDMLLQRANLDWAYSEMFQTYTRDEFQWYMPPALERSEKYGVLVHFAETHDNDRLAKKGKTYARMRVMLSALLSQQGAWGIANGVEWYATEKIDVHGASALNWGAKDNMVKLIASLNGLLSHHPAFGTDVKQRLVTEGGGNTLAVVRIHPSGLRVLVLANLDCETGTSISWRRSEFGEGSPTAFDIITGREFDLRGTGVWLDAGEVVCLCLPGKERLIADLEEEAIAKITPPQPQNAEVNTLLDWPVDVRRDVIVPAGAKLAVRAPYPFRVQVEDGDVTIASARSHVKPYVAILPLPPYSGDGTRADRRKVRMTVFAPEGVRRTESFIMILPDGDEAKVKLSVTGDEVRLNPVFRTVLSNGSGADAFVPVCWGRIMSQYDSFLSVNPNPNVPDNRIVVWTRCRAWLQHEGYSREINNDCLVKFRADPAGRFAMWLFHVPCGMGRQVAFAFRLSLDPGINAARLSVRRYSSGPLDITDSVRLVFRPDIEWRSFHDTTKAQGSVEEAFKNATYHLPGDEGFGFSPYGDGNLEFSVKGGEYHHAPEWTYMVPHPDEAERGQSDCGDLWSPGWISCDFEPGAFAELRAAWGSMKAPMGTPPKATYPLLKETCLVLERDDALVTVPEALSQSLELFVQKRDDLKTVLAGYPWFLDWGRDTLIFLRGYIAAGHTSEALKILTAFARFEENGTIPNIIYGDTAGNRDTVDAPLWLVVAAGDLVRHMGVDVLSTDCTPLKGGKRRTLAEVMASIVESYIRGTDNGISVDPESLLVRNPPHYTWMDTNYPAGTPREGYCVEIQALWIAALKILASAVDEKYGALAEKASKSLVELFYIPGKGFADCLRAAAGIAAKDAVKEDVTRPNQLFALTLDVLPRDADALKRDILLTAAKLVVPGGIRSVADETVKCDMSVVDMGRVLVKADNPYFGRYTGDEDTSRKPAYHNGTVWAWPFPMFAEALFKTHLVPKRTAVSILASAVENLNDGCLAHMSEIADGDSPHAQKGCRAQAWSESELLRVWKELE